jgi:hypothetical protein
MWKLKSSGDGVQHATVIGFMDFVNSSELSITREATFRKLDQFLSSGAETETPARLVLKMEDGKRSSSRNVVCPSGT